jgi:hypothetical protein
LRIIALALLLVTSIASVHAEEAERTILSANEAFEKAWSARDITAIEKLWSHEPYVFVVHPQASCPKSAGKTYAAVSGRRCLATANLRSQ